VTANSLSSWSRVCSDKKHSRKSGAGAFSSLGSSSRPYSPECVEEEFCERPPYGVLRSALTVVGSPTKEAPQPGRRASLPR
jgi:hypothetical protein